MAVRQGPVPGLGSVFVLDALVLVHVAFVVLALVVVCGELAIAK
jgi:hypothetical protein